MSNDPDDKVARLLRNLRISLCTHPSIHCFSLQLLLRAHCMPSSVFGLERQTSLCSRRGFQPGVGDRHSEHSGVGPAATLRGPAGVTDILLSWGPVGFGVTRC